MKWITQAPLTLENSASFWLIKRFIDPKPEFFFAEELELDQKLEETRALPVEIAGSEFSSCDESSAFEQLLISYRFSNPALNLMANKLRGINTEKLKLLFNEISPDLSPEAFTSKSIQNTNELKQILPIFDQLFNWCKDQQNLKQDWSPKTNAGKIF